MSRSLAMASATVESGVNTIASGVIMPPAVSSLYLSSERIC